MGRTPIVHFKEMFTGYEEEDAESAVAIERRIGTGPAE
jgi:hypothetical protein